MNESTGSEKWRINQNKIGFSKRTKTNVLNNDRRVFNFCWRNCRAEANTERIFSLVKLASTIRWKYFDESELSWFSSVLKARVLCSFSHSCSWIKSFFDVPLGMWNFIFVVLPLLMLLMSAIDMKKRLHIEIIYEFVRLICTWLVCNFSTLHDLFEVNTMLLENLHLAYK